MSFESITIYRDYPIIAGFVQIPPNLETDKTAVSEADALVTLVGSTVVSLSLGSGKPTGSKHGAQRFLRLAGLQPGQSYTADSSYAGDPAGLFPNVGQA